MLFTRTTLALLLSALLVSGCATRDSKTDTGDFEMPESVTIDLGIEEESKKPEKAEQQTAEIPEKEAEQPSGPATAIPTQETAAAIKDTDSAEVLARLKKQQPTPAPTLARDVEHERQAQEAKEEFKRALGELKNNNLDVAYARFERLSKKYPALAGPIVNQAIILRKKDKSKEAYDLLQNALLAHAKNPYLLNQLGVVSRELGKFKQAQVSYETAIRIDKNYAKAHYNLGVLADLYLHNPQLALSEFQIYQTLVPEPDKQVAGWIKELQRRAN